MGNDKIQKNIMNQKLLEIREYTGPGYRPVIDYSTWRVAILNYIDEIHPSRINFVERHNDTDEVFVMLKGQGLLFFGEGEKQIGKVFSQVMEFGKIYNVKRGVWHTVVLSRDASVLIVENRDTGDGNSDYSPLKPEQCLLIVETAKREQPDWWR